MLELPLLLQKLLPVCRNRPSHLLRQALQLKTPGGFLWKSGIERLFSWNPGLKKIESFLELVLAQEFMV
jgi:hypothetical protein